MAEATLADLSLGIKQTNDTLAETLSAQKKLNALIVKQNKSTFAGDDLEGQREKDKSQAEAETIRESKSGGGVSDGGGGGGLLGKLGGGLAAAGGAMGLAKLIGGRGIRSALLVALADEAGNAVEAYTGSADAGDAVERGMVAGGIASIFGARFGIIGGLIGASLTEENQKKLKELGAALTPIKDDVVTALEDFGLKLPTVTDVMKGIESTVGGAITGLTNLATGDYEGFKSSLGDIGLTAAGLSFMLKPKGTVMLALKAIKAPFVAASSALSKLAAGSTAATAAAAAAGTTLKPGSVNPKTNRIVGVDGKDTVVDKKDPNAKKLQKEISKKAKAMPKAGGAVSTPKPTGGGKAIAGRLGKFLRFPGIAALLGAYGLYDILSSDAPDEEKKKALGGFMGGMVGSVAGVKFGGLLGGALGTIGFPGLGTAAGGLAGAALFGGAGFFGGEALGESLANFIMGDKPKAPSTGASAPAALPATNTPAGAGGGQAQAAPSQASMSRPARSTPIQSGGAGGEFGGASTVIAPTITNNTGQSTTVITPPTPSANNSEDPVREMSGMAFVL